MTVRRLHMPQSLGAGASVTLNADQAHYLTNVLRMGAGDAVSLFNADSGEWAGMLETGGRKSELNVRLQAQTKSNLPSPASSLTLCFAPLKKTRTDFLVEKASELGVHILQPIITDHTNSERVKVERLQQIAIEAAEQCDRLDVPQVRAPVRLGKLLKSFLSADFDHSAIFLAAERGDALPIATAFQNTPPAANTIFIIGPEGGFSDAEFQLFDCHSNIIRLRLGPRLLRAETAALTTLGIYQGMNCDFVVNT